MKDFIVITPFDSILISAIDIPHAYKIFTEISDETVIAIADIKCLPKQLTTAELTLHIGLS